MRKGKVRNPWVLLLLTVITGGLYFLYWLLINPIEIKNALRFEKGENQIKLTFIFMILSGIFTAGFAVYTFVQSITMNLDDVYFASTIYSLIMVLVSGLFFYYFCKSVHLAQQKVKIEPFEFLTIYGIYLLNILIETGSDIKILSTKFFKDLPETVSEHTSTDIKHLTELLPVLNVSGLLNLLSFLLFLFFLFLLQRQINRIWEKGNWDTETKQST